MQHLQPNTTLQGGKYRIERVLGQGGFGITYLARNTVFDIDVAIKEFFMKDENDRDGSSVTMPNTTKQELFHGQMEKFKKEAKRMFAIKNEHIIGVQDLFEENGTAYYVMDYVDGENLAERVKRTGKPMTEQEVRKILPQILDALKSVHDAGIWHLDLKPANIMVDKAGNVKLIDFGASKQLNTQKGGATTSTTISYTNGFAPREQMEQNYDKFGPWTDIYALGATLYNLLTNKRPPLPTDIDDDISENKHEALPFPSTTSNELKALIIRMMNTNRMKRPQSIEEVEKLLKNPEIKKRANTTKPTQVKSVPSSTPNSNSRSNNDEETIVAGTGKKEESKFEEKSYLIPFEYTSNPSLTANDANNGDVESVFAMGMMALRGQGVQQDFDVAYKWFELAKKNGDDRAESIIKNWNTLKDKYTPKTNNQSTISYDDSTTNWKKWAILLTGIAIIIGIFYFSRYGNVDTDAVSEIDSSSSPEVQNQVEVQRKAEAQKLADEAKKAADEAQRQAEAQKVCESFNVNVSGNTYNNGYQDFIVLSVQGTDSKTILKKKCLPSLKTYMYCSPDEFIEDCATGKRYYLNGSSIGVNRNKYFYDTNPFYFSEYYPKLPNTVTRINISSGNFYFAKNVRIR